MHYHKAIQVRILFVFFCVAMIISTPTRGQRFMAIRSSEGVEIRENNQKVMFYQVRPKSVGGKYERAGYVHPLYSLNGQVLTEDMPPDHPYHRGIFWAWHQIIWNDKRIADGWTSENISWSPAKVKVYKGKESLTLRSEMIWNIESEKVAIIRENTKITVFKSTRQYRILDFEIQLLPLVPNLKIGGSEDDKGYGGFCLRLKLPEDISFISGSRSITPQKTAVSASPRMDFTGSFDGASLPEIGVAAFSYLPGSDQQQLWILRSPKDPSMQNIVYPGRAPVELPGKGLILRYRVIIHNGEIKNDDLKKLFQEYIKTK